MGKLLIQIDRNIWTVESVQRFLGVDFGGRMTVIRLSSGDLFLHSPVKLDDSLASELEALGDVRYLVAPNKFHHLHLADYISKYPCAQLWGAPGLAKKRGDIDFTGELDSASNRLWPGEIEYVLFEGVPFINEVVFYHPLSRTVMFTDLIFNYSTNESIGVKVYAWIDGVYGKPDLSRLIKYMVRDREKARDSIRKILSWDFDRVSCTHRDIVTTGGKKIISAALSVI